MNMKCPVCGAAELVSDTRNIVENGVLISAVSGDFCPACGEVILDERESDRVMNAIADARKGQRAIPVDLKKI